MSKELSSPFSLEGKAALITGANTGLGRAMALGFVTAGARVAATGRDRERNSQVAVELGENSAVFALDVQDEAAVERVVTTVLERFGKLDILVNNAGYGRTGPLSELSLEDWNASLGLNLTGPFLCSKHAAKAMVARGEGGKIINISSIYALFGTPNFSSYGAAKTGLLGFTRSLAVELAEHDIQVNAILPGWFNTERTKRVQESPFGEQIRCKTPAGRWGEPEDLVGAAIFFASAASNFVTGTCLAVDGGYAVMERLLEA